MVIHYKDTSIRQALTKFFHFINAAQMDTSKHLTPTEIKLLIEFILLPPKFQYHRFSRLAKSKVQEFLSNSDSSWNLSRENLNNKLYSMLDKDILRRDEDKVIYLAKHIESPVFELIRRLSNNEPYTITFKFSPPSNGT